MYATLTLDSRWIDFVEVVNLLLPADTPVTVTVLEAWPSTDATPAANFVWKSVVCAVAKVTPDTACVMDSTGRKYGAYVGGTEQVTDSRPDAEQSVFSVELLAGEPRQLASR